MKILKSGGKLHFIKNRYLRWKEGAGCCDTYSLYYFLAPKISKGLKAFKKRAGSYPMGITENEWDSILDEMIFAFDYCSGEEETTEGDERSQKGLELFGKYFRGLWY
jgi:hypothetical protein